MDIDLAVEQAKKALLEADAVVVMAGAGMSVDSGLPDFRGDKGFWASYPEAEKLGLSFADIATADTFNKKPRLAWAFYGHRLQLYRDAVPHIGYQKLLNLCQSKAGSYFVFTSNVDGHFKKAGFDRERIVECHGSINRFQCVEPCDDYLWNAVNLNIEISDDFIAQGELPACSFCGDTARPNILMFNDAQWVNSETEKQKINMYYWWQDVQREELKTVVIEIGAGSAIKSVRNQAESYANYPNVTLIRINPSESATEKGIAIPLTALDAITALVG